jgi:hypothetical protein
MLTALAEAGWVAETAALDSTYIKAHRSAHGGKRMARPGRKRLVSIGLISLQKRIRPSGFPLAKMEIRASRSS